MEEKYTVLDEIKNAVNDKERLAEVIFDICWLFNYFLQDVRSKVLKETKDKHFTFSEYCVLRKSLEINIIKDILDSGYELSNKLLLQDLSKKILTTILEVFKNE